MLRKKINTVKADFAKLADEYSFTLSIIAGRLLKLVILIILGFFILKFKCEISNIYYDYNLGIWLRYNVYLVIWLFLLVLSMYLASNLKMKFL